MKARLIHLLLSIGSLVALSLQPSSAEAIFASVKAIGMGGACISYPLDSLVGAYNPAGMPDVGDRFDVEGGWLQDWGHAKTVGNETPIFAPLINGTFDGMRHKYVFPGSFGINKNWCIADDWVVSTGLVFYNRNYQKTTYKQPLILFGTSNAGLEYLNQTVSPMVAIQWCNAHTLAISANCQLQRLKVNGLQNFDIAAIPGVPGGTLFPGHVTNRGYSYSNGWGFTIGYLGHFSDCLSIGLTYQPRTSMKRFGKYTGFLAHKGVLDIPAKFGGGISYRFLPEWIVAFDVEYIQWDRVHSLRNPLLNDGFLEPLGATNGPGFGFRDQIYYRVGLEWAFNECLSFRAGYRYANTPVKRSQTAVNVLTLDLVESFATVGATWNFYESNEASFFFAYGFQHKVNGKNSIPDFLGGGEVNVQEQKYALGLSWGHKF